MFVCILNPIKCIFSTVLFYILLVCVVSGELPLVSSAGPKRKEFVDIGSLLNKLVVLWTRMPSAHVTLHLLFSEPTFTAIISASDLQVTTSHIWCC